MQARGQNNDNFENATVLSGTVVTAFGTNTTATLQTGEANIYGMATLWWRWTAPGNGLVTIDTAGSTFDTVLVAYVGNTVDQVVPVAVNNNTPTTNTSRIVFQTAAGQAYQIAVGVNGYPSYGTFVSQLHLNFAPSGGPASVAGLPSFNDRLPITGLSGIGIGYLATGSPLGNTRWWNWTAPSSGVVTIDNRDSEAYTSISVYVGSNYDYLLPVRMADHNADGGSYSQVSFQVAPGTTYQIALRVPAGIASYGNVVMNLNLDPNSDAATVVGTDDFNAPHDLTDFLAHGVANSSGAGRQTGERNVNDDNQNTVWWSWVAPADGMVIVDTMYSDFDTTLFVFTGQSVDSLLLVTNNDNYNGQTTSRVVFNAQAHQRYQIAVAGSGAAGVRVGNIDLHVYQPGGPDDRLHIYTAVEVELFTRAQQCYQLQRSPDLTKWQDVGGPFYGSNTFVSWFFPTRPGEKEFYRAKPVSP